MNEIVTKDWSDLPSIWNEVLANNPKAIPLQFYEFLTFTGKGKPYRKDLFRTIGLKEINLVLYANNTPIAIAPLLYKKHKKATIVYFRGHFTSACQLGFVSGNWSYDDFKFLMEGIRSMLGNVSFFLDRVLADSPDAYYLMEYMQSANIEKHDCYAIPIPDDHGEWFDGLKKSVRHHIRNSANRLKKNQITSDTTFYVSKKVDEDIYKDMIMVYADRFIVKNNFKLGPFRPIAKKALHHLLLKDKMTQWLNNVENCFHVIVYMNNEIAAIACGQILKDKRILFHRLAINTKYGKYSPGAVLFDSTMRFLSQQKRGKRIDVDRLDLSKEDYGGLHYKRAYGGKLYHKYSFVE